MENQKWYDTNGIYDIGIIQYFDDVIIEIGTDDNPAILKIEDAIELYELLPSIIEDAKNRKQMFSNNKKQNLQDRIKELQKELDSLE